MKPRLYFLKKLRWLYPGIKIKRWIALLIGGIYLLVVGATRYQSSWPYQKNWLLVLKLLHGLIAVLGAAFVLIGAVKILQSILSLLLPHHAEKDLVDIIFKKRFLERGPKIVAVGGGHGLSALLFGIKDYTSNLTAIVTVADSGGSSGRLREEFGMLPPGDIRNCLVALADAPTLMGELFQYRFEKDSDLKGHNFGNLFITAMTQLTGDFEKAVKESSKVLAIRGQVVPSTLNKVALVAEYKDGSTVEGEAVIPEKGLPIKRIYLKLSDASTEIIQPTSDAIKAIQEAELIILGPGSLYTSILPNLVIKEISEAIVNSHAPKIYVSNVMTQHGETDGYSAFDHLYALIQHTHPRIVDYCVVNGTPPPTELLYKYSQEKSFPTLADIKRIEEAGYKVIQENVISTQDYVRHDPKKLAKVIINSFRRVSARR
ncbi:MAG: gluconeogenesis factor YvcK family protein [Candidatus Omnitrophota bacterium]